jgi:dTDP-4-amino-4,6-dideoxygalactose transaminase
LRVHGGKPKYYHKIIGGNFRIDAIQAAVLNVKLPHLDKWTAGRRKNASLYTKFFIEEGLAEETGRIEYDNKNRVLLPKAVYTDKGLSHDHIYNQYVIRVKGRDEVRKHLTDNEIGTEIYYPVPFHLQECFAYLGYKKGDFPVSEWCADDSIAVPIYPELTEEQIRFTVKTIADFLNK